jgi:hypothetical protein
MQPWMAIMTDVKKPTRISETKKLGDEAIPFETADKPVMDRLSFHCEEKRAGENP